MKHHSKLFLFRAVSVILTLGMIFGMFTCMATASEETYKGSENQNTISSNAVDAIKKQQEAAKTGYSGYYISEKAVSDNPIIPETGKWSYSYKVAQPDERGYYVPVGSFISEKLDKYDDNYTGDGNYKNSVLPKMFYNSSQAGKTLGIGIKQAVSGGENAKIIMTASMNGSRAQALSFTAEKDGKVDIVSPSFISMETAWTLNGTDEAIGFAIYKGETKIWPADKDYYEITAKNISTSIFPTLSDIEVVKGEKIHFMLIPLNNDWGMFSFMPEVIYNEGSDWSYSESGMSNGMPDGKWQNPSLMHVSKTSDAHTTEIPDYLAKKQGCNDGYGVYNGKAITYLNTQYYSSGGGHAVALTYTACKDGFVTISDPASGNFNGVFWGFGSGGYSGTVGFAVYNGEEKVWPLNSNYYAITADKTEFPQIYGIKVKKGDKLHLTLIPVDTGYSYIQLAPQVDYISFLNTESSNAVDAIKKQQEAAKTGYSGYYISEKAVSDNPIIPETGKWSYSYKVAQPDERGYYVPVGSFISEKLDKYDDNYTGDGNYKNSVLPKMFYNSSQAGKTLGIGIKQAVSGGENAKIIMTASMNGSRAQALSFTAEKDGKVDIVSPSFISMETAWTLNGTDEAIGFAIYKGETKIWPADKDYYEITAKNISTSIFPTLSDIEVVKGEKIHFMLIPLNNDWGMFSFMPEVIYNEGSDWSYSESGMSNGMPDGKWQNPSLMHVSKTSDAHTTEIPDYLAKKQGCNDGYGVYNGKAITYLNTQYYSSGGGHAVALTYTACKDGFVTISDPASGNFNGVFWGFGSGGYSGTVGFAVYNGEEKVWPLNSNYYAITADKTEFPQIYGIKVKKGDKLHLTLIPVDTGYSYIQLAPQVDYISFLNTDYNAYDAVKSQENRGYPADWRIYNEGNWRYEERTLKSGKVMLNGNETEVQLPQGDFVEPILKKGNWCSSSEEVRNALSDMYYIWDATGESGRGIATYDGKVVLSIGTALNRTSSITYTTPFSGNMRLFDPDGGKITKKFVTLDSGEMVGLAIYKNNEKIWPKANESEFEGLYVFHGEVWNDGVMTNEGNTSRIFPQLDLDVCRGDKIRIELVPLTESWGYMALSPQVSYRSITEKNWNNEPIGMDIDCSTLNYFTGEDYNFAVSLRRSDGTIQQLKASDYIMTSEKAPDTAGMDKVDILFVENDYTVNRTVNVKVYDKLYGDLNADTAISSADMVLLRQYLLGINSNLHISVSDLNDDGFVNIIDLVKFKKYFADKSIILGPKPKGWVDAVKVDSSSNPVMVTTVDKENSCIKKLGKEYLSYGVQFQVNIPSDQREMYFAKAKELGFNTVLTAVKWQDIEPYQGGYNLAIVNDFVTYAEKYNLNLELLWFGSNVCGSAVTVPSYIINNKNTYQIFWGHESLKDGRLNYENTNVLAREKKALSAVMDYLYVRDKTCRVSSVQIENESNWGVSPSHWDYRHYLNYLNELGLVVKKSHYRVVTRVNLISNEDTVIAANGGFASTLPSDIFSLEGIDIVGPDIYVNNDETIKAFIEPYRTGAMAGNFMHFAETAGSATTYSRQVLTALANKSGFYAYDLRSPEYTAFDLGIYRKSNTEWIERDGSKDISFEWDPNTTFKECKTQDIKTLNSMINVLSEKISGSKKNNIIMIKPDECLNVNNQYFNFIATETTDENKAAMILYSDGYYYFFTMAEGSVFSVKGWPSKTINGTISIGRFDASGNWVQTEADSPYSGTINASRGKVYRIAASQIS